jgi:hypothetical protein
VPLNLHPSSAVLKSGIKYKAMKKIIPLLIFSMSLGYAQAQDVTVPSSKVPHIRVERKELKREKFEAREIKSGMEIRHGKRQLQHIRNGKHHEWRPIRPMHPVRGIQHRKPAGVHRRR